jgi:type IV pilus assembly protein PilO
MNPALERFLDRPASHKWGFVVISFIFLGYLFWQFLYAEKLQKFEEATSKVDSLNSSIQQEKRIARNLSKFKEEVKDLEAKLKFALTELPDKREIPDLLSTVSGRARDSGLEVTLFKPLPETFREFYAEVPVLVNVQGTYHQIATFFDEVAKLPRIVNINQIAIRDAKIGEEEVSVKAECTAVTFRYLDEAERVKSPDAEKKKRRKR